MSTNIFGDKKLFISDMLITDELGDNELGYN
jgi:hypothetical protein